eukprot:CAMPEP_0116020056 /NCGR_PEP_ID=MMETSP0321-20121206/9582_1 /TAXON_ID=163516 /ORGANISM="Leptocylindrus danicus var. danicus, Strain B650" /LENGTH=620 /DNA_ID=CAMNT_0003490699 /DNA_START=213 /DNA_END=2075 /DNA_ORIENTATION=+
MTSFSAVWTWTAVALLYCAVGIILMPRSAEAGLPEFQFPNIPDQVGKMLSNLPSLPFMEDKQKEGSESDEVLADLSKLPIAAVTASQSKVLPKEVVELAAKRSGMVGKPLSSARVAECAKFLKQWYQRQGFVLSSVIGATITPDGVTDLKVEEPTLADDPVAILFAKEMVVVEEKDGTEGTMTFKEFRKKELKRNKTRPPTKRSDLNTTFVQTEGRTKSEPIARTLNLHPGEPFRWNKSRWDRILRSGLFSRVLRTTPERLKDGTVQLQVIASEPPPRNLEYGVTKSFYTGGWEGEVEFEHRNLLGGGEVASVVVRRGAKDPYPSIRARFTDDRFGLEGGYGVEAFSEYIALDGDDGQEQLSEEYGDEDEGNEMDRPDSLLGRTGATFRLNHPLASVMDRSAGSVSLERTTTRAGKHEAVASTTFDAGPWLRGFPDESRHSLLTTVTGGTRISTTNSFDVLPYASGTILAREVFPLGNVDRPISLALKHSVTTSSPSLPTHEANAAGIKASVRGYGSVSNGAVSTSAVGSTELRVPISLPTEKVRQDASVVLFGDWHFVETEGGSRGKKVGPGGRFSRKSSVGLGLRKSIQGIPLKYDICYTEDGKFGTFFGIGKDFDVI